MFVHIHTRGDEAVVVEQSWPSRDYEIRIGDAVVLLSSYQAGLLARALIALLKQSGKSDGLGNGRALGGGGAECGGHPGIVRSHMALWAWER